MTSTVDWVVVTWKGWVSGVRGAISKYTTPLTRRTSGRLETSCMAEPGSMERMEPSLSWSMAWVLVLQVMRSPVVMTVSWEALNEVV